ncbi:hypothetical protein SIPHO054v2_p0052 [Vibrio phage 103E44.1]|nr:hypothetical protein SIPHO054v2_p0052 [Vibrio phage 103E44.1]QZI87906.1 hypothetical protein SIPHO055v2_p0051 [Vibrio phage 104E43.1]
MDNLEFIEENDFDLLDEGEIYISPLTVQQCYRKALENNLVVSVVNNTGLNYREFKVIPHNDVRPKTLANCLVLASQNGKGDMVYDISMWNETVSVSGLRQAIKRVMKQYGVYLEVSYDPLFPERITLRRHVYETQYKTLLGLMMTGNYDDQSFEIVDAPRYHRRVSQLIRTMASKLNIPISIDGTTVKRKSLKDMTPRSQLVMWVNDLPYDTPMTYHGEISNIRQVLSGIKQYELTYRNNQITKHRYRLCNVDGGVEIRTNGQTLTRIDNVKTSTLSAPQIALLNMRMLPYNVTVTDSKELRYDTRTEDGLV